VTNQQQLFSQFTQQATQAGISGEAVIDSHPGEGFIRMKLRWNPPEKGKELTRGVADVLATVLGMMNVSVKIRQNE